MVQPQTFKKMKKSAAEFMKYLYDSMDHPVSQRDKIYQLDEIRIKSGKTSGKLIKWI